MHRCVIKKLDHLKLKKHLSEKGRFEILLAVPSFLVDFSLRLIEKVFLLINTKIQLESNVYLVSFITAPSQLTLFHGGGQQPPTVKQLKGPQNGLQTPPNFLNFPISIWSILKPEKLWCFTVMFRKEHPQPINVGLIYWLKEKLFEAIKLFLITHLKQIHVNWKFSVKYWELLSCYFNL